MALIPRFVKEKVDELPSIEKHVVHAIKALERGDATPEQQKSALKFIVFSLSKIDNISYRSDSERDTAFLEGRRFVGWGIGNILGINLTNLKK